MTTIEPPRRDNLAAAPLLFSAGCAIAAVGLVIDVGSLGLAIGACLLAAAVVVRRPTFSWKRVLVALVLVILFVPIRRYEFTGDLPFQLEPYRLLVALIFAGWAASLLTDPRVRLHRSGFEGPLALLVGAALMSIVANPTRLDAYEPIVLKAFTFFLSFVVVFYVIVSVARTPAIVDALVKTLVGGGSVVALLAMVEARFGHNPFTGLDAVLPLVVPDAGEDIIRGSATRAYGPAEHPIALGAALVMLVPLAVYLARTSSARWWVPLGVLVLGALATVSRTGGVMLLVICLVFLALKPRETKRLWPLVVPLLVATHFLLPGTLGSLRSAFFPEGGLVAQQREQGVNCDSGGRIADVGPTLDEVGKKPFFGYGYGTRIVTGPERNACILDNQWLGTLVELGIVGVLAWLWLFISVLRRLGGKSKDDDSPRGWLLVAASASIIAYAVGMASFDALGFVQVTFLLFVILGLGAAAAAVERRPGDALSRLQRDDLAPATS